VVLDEPAVKLVNTWGLSDRYSFINDQFPRTDGSRPLPFDRALHAKPAAQAMLDAFAAAPSR